MTLDVRVGQMGGHTGHSGHYSTLGGHWVVTLVTMLWMLRSRHQILGCIERRTGVFRLELCVLGTRACQLKRILGTQPFYDLQLLCRGWHTWSQLPLQLDQFWVQFHRR